MFNGEVFTLNVPRLNPASSDTAPPLVADGCEANSNYYSDDAQRGTCCCGCGKPIVY